MSSKKAPEGTTYRVVEAFSYTPPRTKDEPEPRPVWITRRNEALVATLPAAVRTDLVARGMVRELSATSAGLVATPTAAEAEVQAQRDAEAAAEADAEKVRQAAQDAQAEATSTTGARRGNSGSATNRRA